jgi:hypothetical protein
MEYEYHAAKGLREVAKGKMMDKKAAGMVAMRDEH